MGYGVCFPFSPARSSEREEFGDILPRAEELHIHLALACLSDNKMQILFPKRPSVHSRPAASQRCLPELTWNFPSLPFLS